MRIIVCIKQVPDTNEVRLDKKTGTLIREGVPSIINPDDKAALEAALSIKDATPDTMVSVLCMGPMQADDAIREALAMGADEGVLLSDRAYAGSDTWATANILSAAIKRMGGYDLILCGRQAIDGDTAQVGPQLACRLGIPQVTCVKDIVLGEKNVQVESSTQQGFCRIRVILPCLLTIVKEMNKPRYPNFQRIFQAYAGVFPVQVWTQRELGISEELIGLESSPTKVKRTFEPGLIRSGIRLEGSEKEMAVALIRELENEQIIARRS